MKLLWMMVKVECIKLRHSLAFMVAVAAPAVIAVVQIAMYVKYMEFYLGGNEHNPWQTYNQTMLVYWALLMLPLFLTLEAALLAQMENRPSNWKLLYCQPVPRWSIYIAKYLMGWLLLAASSLILIGFMLASGTFLMFLFPEYHFDAPFPWIETLKNLLIVSASSALLLSIQTWISLRWSNFIVPVIVGVAATVAAIFIFSTEYLYWYPWSIPGATAMDINLLNIPSLLFGISGLLWMLPACLDLSQLEFDG